MFDINATAGEWTGMVSQVIQEAIEAPRPKARYHAGISLSGELVLHLGDSV
jgi:hypothetical protein